jgi:hypothetical protein
MMVQKAALISAARMTLGLLSGSGVPLHRLSGGGKGTFTHG